MIFVSPPIVRSGLVLHYDAASNPRCYPGTGTLVKDLSGNNNNGTLTGGVGYSTGNMGSFSFDGVDDHIFLSTAFNNTSGTWSCWFKATDITRESGTYNRRLIHQSNGTNGLYRIDLDQGIGDVRITSDFWPALTANGIVVNTWYHVAATYNGTTVSLYLNGVLKGSVSQTSQVNTSAISLAIGRFNYTNLAHFVGNIPIVQIYNRALTAAEVLQNFNAHRSRFSI
jgi:hypothetical protein